VDVHATDLVGINGITRVFFIIHLSARCVPSRPRTTPSTPLSATLNVYVVLCIAVFNFCIREKELVVCAPKKSTFTRDRAVMSHKISVPLLQVCRRRAS
jgi:hypothetical protein